VPGSGSAAGSAVGASVAASGVELSVTCHQHI
jgi:hypothetical protein